MYEYAPPPHHHHHHPHPHPPPHCQVAASLLVAVSGATSLQSRQTLLGSVTAGPGSTDATLPVLAATCVVQVVLAVAACVCLLCVYLRLGPTTAAAAVPQDSCLPPSPATDGAPAPRPQQSPAPQSLEELLLSLTAPPAPVPSPPLVPATPSVAAAGATAVGSGSGSSIGSASADALPDTLARVDELSVAGPGTDAVRALLVAAARAVPGLQPGGPDGLLPPGPGLAPDGSPAAAPACEVLWRWARHWIAAGKDAAAADAAAAAAAGGPVHHLAQVALAAAEKAVALNPACVNAHKWYGGQRGWDLSVRGSMWGRAPDPSFPPPLPPVPPPPPPPPPSRPRRPVQAGHLTEHRGGVCGD
jgi:hypothetical protein